MKANMLLFIPEFISGDYSKIIQKMCVEGVIWIIVLVAMIIDLHYGIRKAKSQNEYISSHGIKRTVYKFKDYYSALLYALLGDILLSVFTYYLPFPLSIVPIVSIIVGLLLVWTEFKSVKEKGSEKVWRQMNQSANEMAQFYNILKEKELTDKFFEFIKEKEDERKNNDTDS